MPISRGVAAGAGASKRVLGSSDAAAGVGQPRDVRISPAFADEEPVRRDVIGRAGDPVIADDRLRGPDDGPKAIASAPENAIGPR